MSSDEECDYMSADFLEKCVPTTDVRPGLIHNRSQQRSHVMLKKKKESQELNKQRFRPHRVVEAERREEGLNVALGNENKGFALLQKMGYKPGSGIGKTGTGIVEPVSIDLKVGRGGLGREAALKQVAADKAVIRRRLQLQREQPTSIEDYRLRMTKRASERQTNSDLFKSQRICEQMDKDKGFSDPPEIWFWPKKEEPETEEDIEQETTVLERLCAESSEEPVEEPEAAESQIEFDPAEKLEMLTKYLRSVHFYCLWCGNVYDDEKDLQDCPGPTREDH